MQNNKDAEVLLIEQKVIFCDIDGTLIDDEKLVHTHTLKKIQELINNHYDYHFALASGRNLAEELFLYKRMQLKNTGLLIGSNGAQIYALKSHKIIFEKTIDPKIVKKIYDEFLRLNEKCHHIGLMVTYSDNSSYLFNFNEDEWWENYNFSKSKRRSEFSTDKVLIINFFALLETEKEMLNFLDKLEINVIPGPNLTAITAKNASKEDAIKFCIKHYNLDLKNIAVIGNSKNDKGMFMLPDVFSITYTGAKPYLKDIAKIVIDEPKSQFIKEGLIQFEQYINNINKNKEKN